MSEEEFRVADYAAQALERQQAAARRRGHFPTSVGARKPVPDQENPATSDVVDLNLNNLETRYINSPGIAPADLLTGRDLPKKIDQVMQRLVAAYGWADELSVAALSENWEQIVGQSTAAHCWVESYDPEKKILRVGTDSQVWATQLRLLLPQIEEKIASLTQAGTVSQLLILGPESTARRRPSEQV